MTQSLLELLNQVEKELPANEKEYFEIHEARYQKILASIQSLHLSPKAAVLDVGCYPPHQFSVLQKLGYDVWGVASHHEKYDLPQVKIVNIETEKLPFKDNQFDLLVLSEVIEHLLIDPRVYLSKMLRVLKPGGKILISTPNAVHLKHRINMLLGKPVTFSIEQLLDTKLDDGSIYHRHNKEFTKQELEKVVEASGFTISHSSYFSAYVPWRKSNQGLSTVTLFGKWLGHWITQIVPSTRDSLLVIAEKSK